jgi:hypothetical protein
MQNQSGDCLKRLGLFDRRFLLPRGRTFGDAVTTVLRPPSRPEQRGQYRATNMIVTTMNAATSDSARSNAFDRVFAVASDGTMILTSAAALRQRASQHLRTSSDLTLSRFSRRSRIRGNRTSEAQTLLAPARSSQGSYAFGMWGSGAAAARVAELRLGNRSLHSTLGSGGSAKLSVTGRCRGER